MPIIQPVRTTLNTSTFVAVNLDSSIRQNVDTSSYTEDGTSFIISNTSAGTVSATIPASTTYKDINVSTGTTAFYAKATAGTPVLVTLTSRI